MTDFKKISLTFSLGYVGMLLIALAFFFYDFISNKKLNVPMLSIICTGTFIVGIVNAVYKPK